MPSLKILAETETWLVVDKPAGLSVHNESPNVLTLLKERDSRCDYHLVHRLDQETSGVLLIAKRPDVAARFMDALAAGSSEKYYVAVLRGKMKTENADWTWALTDKAEGRKNPQGMSKDRKPCRTLVKVLNSSDYLSLVECQILTGRQHQVRKHAALAKHAIVGDRRYNDPKYNERIAELYKTERMFLHARSLKIFIDGQMQMFTAEVPGEFLRMVSENV
jgi:RluA family pseudouridine synthase